MFTDYPAGIVWAPIRHLTLHFRDRRSEASLRYRNSAVITVLMCQQKPYPGGIVLAPAQKLSVIGVNIASVFNWNP